MSRGKQTRFSRQFSEPSGVVFVREWRERALRLRDAAIQEMIGGEWNDSDRRGIQEDISVDGMTLETVDDSVRSEIERASVELENIRSGRGATTNLSEHHLKALLETEENKVLKCLSLRTRRDAVHALVESLGIENPVLKGEIVPEDLPGHNMKASKRTRSEIHRPQNAAVPVHVVRNNCFEFEQVSSVEARLLVRVYHPHSARVVQEFFVLSSQTLNSLKENIYCLADHAPSDDQEVRSGFFFIEGIFYDDLSDPRMVSYSAQFVQWILSSQCHADFAVDPNEGIERRMEDTTFDSLKIRLGAPYLYFHAGICEHFFTFEEVSLVSPQDDQNLKLYPLLVYQEPFRKRRCMICDVLSATYV